MGNLHVFICLLFFTLCCTNAGRNPDYFECLKNCKSWDSHEAFDPSRDYTINYNCLNGSTIPDFTYINLEGDKKSMHDNNNYALLNFWFLGCKPCIDEIPELVYLNSQNNIRVISIALDNKEDLSEFIKTRQNIIYEIVPNGKNIIRDSLQMPFAYPTNYFINPEGKIIGVYDKLTKGQVDEIVRLSNE